MNRREFMLAAAALTLPVAVPATASPADLRGFHQRALVAAKARIQLLGRQYVASGRCDRTLQAQRIAEARRYAAHHRALSRLA